MSERLGKALVDRIRRLDGDSKYVLVEAVSKSVALAMSRAWSDSDTRLPALAVATDAPREFGEYALAGASGTGMRNRFSRGVCLVICEGADVPDRQSLNSFENLAPSDLLRDPEGLSLLAQVSPPIPADSVANEARKAVAQLPASQRPSAFRVAEYFDKVAAGENALNALPTLGCFRDDAIGERIDSTRIRENMLLAERRREDDLMRPGSVADIRRRAERVVARRPTVSSEVAARMADHLISLLQGGDDSLLSAITFDEAREILDRQQQDLSTQVVQAINDYRRSLQGEAPAEDVPWERYLADGEALRRPDDRRQAAGELIGFDDVEGRRVFVVTARRKLERLLKDKVIAASNPSSPELGLLRATLALSGGIKRVRLVRPEPASATARPSRAMAARALSIECARLRLKGLFLALREHFGVDVDASLLQACQLPWDGVFEDAELHRGRNLELVELKLYGADGDVLSVEWRPDLDDVATLRAALLFSEQPILSLHSDGDVGLSWFAGGGTAHQGAVSEALLGTARALQRASQTALEVGLSAEVLDSWSEEWRNSVEREEATGSTTNAAELALAGGVAGPGTAALTVFAPMKSEWLGQQLDAMWNLVLIAMHGDQFSPDEPVEETAAGVARATAAHYPAFLRLPTRDRPLLPASESRIWSTFGATQPDTGRHAADALESVMTRLLDLQPEIAGHLRCLAWGSGAADLLVGQAVSFLLAPQSRVEKAEVFCVEGRGDSRPSLDTLSRADVALAGVGRDRLEIRYIPELAEAERLLLTHGRDVPAVHLAVVAGLTEGGENLELESPETDTPPITDEALFIPRTWTRPRSLRRMLMAPPAVTETGMRWLHLMNAVDEAWPDTEGVVRIPELRTMSLDISPQLQAAHRLALWVATLDRYATRDSLQQALGEEVAILHQDRRLGGESPLSLVLSQRSGGPADRAIGRSLKSARIVTDTEVAMAIGADLRKVASQGYGILALEAATTGAGINELVGHVVAFSLLATAATPWPLPPDCRLLLISLDDYKPWFPNKRADLLVLALDESDQGVHGAVIEVKARRSDASVAATDAVDQLRQTLHITRWVAFPDTDTVHSRLWLNRIAEAAASVARESSLRLTARELAALERFRQGRGTLEWAGIGLVFHPEAEAIQRHIQQPIAGDLVPISIQSVRLTQSLLERAARTQLRELATVETQQGSLGGGRVRRRPERAQQTHEAAELVRSPIPEEPDEPDVPTAMECAEDPSPGREPDAAQEAAAGEVPEPDVQSPDIFSPPILGWGSAGGEPVLWPAAGVNALPNGHMEIWGSSGMGKTQFVKALLAQLATTSSARFGVADFKNDYGDDWPGRVDATFIDLWSDEAPFNPLALNEDSDRAVERAVIELRDIVEVATQSFARLGVRQKAKLSDALAEAYRVSRASGTWPTLLTLDSLLDADLRGIVGDLTRTRIFGEGRPLGDAVDENLVFGLSQIPGNGLTTVLAAGFILSALQLKMQSLAPVSNTVRYALVVDEAHRVSAFGAVDTMIREGRSKGLAVVLATQQPGDLPDVISTNAQTKVCFRLPDASVATAAARRLDPGDSELPEQIRTLDIGEALVSLGGLAPRMVRMAQYWRDSERLAG